MSKPGRIYRITQQAFDPASDIQEVCDISDNDYLVDDSATVDIITLQGAPQPFRLSVIDSDEDILTPVKSQQLTIQFLSDGVSGIGMNTFASGSDARWSFHLYIATETLLRGFLVLNDMSEDFMPDPNIVVLTGTDGLGLLKDIPWVDFSGNNPVGDYKLASIIMQCLYRTGVVINLHAAFNIKLAGLIDDISIVNTTDEHFFSKVYLNAKTFEDQIGTCINCYDVLKRILGEEARVFQRNGVWFIQRIDEMIVTGGVYITTFSSSGIFLQNTGAKTWEKSVGKDSPYTIFFSREQTRVVPTRPVKDIKESFSYEYPQEVPDNTDFDRGDLIDGTNPLSKTYKIADWVSLFSNTSTDDAPTTPIYIRRIFVNDYETERYVVIEAKSGDFNFIMSNPIRVGLKDKFILGLEMRLSSDVGGSGFYRDNSIQVRLYGNDGTFWTHQSANSASAEKKWVACTSTFRTNQKFFSVEGDSVNDQTESIGLYNGESAEIPVAGYIRIILGASENFGDDHDTYYSGLSFDYRPYINGSHGKFTGQEQTVTQSGAYKEKRETQVYMTDAPRMLQKGAMLKELSLVEIFSGSVDFLAGTSFNISGYQLGLFRAGQIINISGGSLSDQTARVISAIYHVIIDKTEVSIDGSTFFETHTASIKEQTFELANSFYNAALNPAGPPDATYLHPYSEIQAYDVFNQFVYDRRIFQATLQGCDLGTLDADSLANNAHLIYKWTFTDMTSDTINRVFILLTFDQDHRIQEWSAVFREIDNSVRTKIYTGRVFKYLT
jgi:hypothetical protein